MPVKSRIFSSIVTTRLNNVSATQYSCHETRILSEMARHRGVCGIGLVRAGGSIPRGRYNLHFRGTDHEHQCIDGGSDFPAGRDLQRQLQRGDLDPGRSVDV